MRLGVDTGGTFTDVVDESGSLVKVLSTRRDPSVAVRSGVAALGAPDVLAHGTTVATNTLLERRGAVVALLTNEGFDDLIEIARQDRPALYDQWADRPEPLVPRSLRLTLPGRIAADGTELVALDLSKLPPIPPDVDTVAVCFLHADRWPRHEEMALTALASRGVDAVASHQVSPEHREYERLVTTVVNAYVRPSCRTYLARLGDVAPIVLVMTSAGGLVPLDRAADRPASLLLSGPAAGVRAAAAVASANGFPDAVSFDMGGTSTDVCLVAGGVPTPAPSREIGGFPVRLPALDIHTIGAGGGSIARIDAGGALAVGPESAGADPGPACYGRGGREATVTDADLVAGHIAPRSELPGLGVLDLAAATEAIDRAGVTAEGVLTVVDAAMAQAVRKVTVERGVDPRDLALVAFGGAGPMHACALAELVGMSTVVVPARAGVLCAVGLLGAPVQYDIVQSWRGGDHRASLERLATDAAASLRAHGDVEVVTAVDCRYPGQSHELTVPTPDAFHAEHARRNGYARPHEPAEVVALRASARVSSPVNIDELPSLYRSEVRGPAVVSEADCTIWVPEGWSGAPGIGGALVLTRI
ncbi:MAG TPA: hydantoinase/oxoprolinase family protein [Acidimicrobiales bacterium]|nr:hydantoinase/oxoprolinase family protein [Acidimicrobiales bacterium]